MIIDPRHVANAARARALYLDNLKPQEGAADWYFAKRDARKLVAAALRSSNFLTNIEQSLQASGGHTLVFRHLLAPPLSQDQFKLVCQAWSKQSEKKATPVLDSSAQEVAAAICSRLDRGLAPWAASGRMASRREIVTLLQVASSMMAGQKIATARRSRLSFEQEYTVETLLAADGWTRLPSKLIDTRAAVPPRFFMRKTRFATNTTTHQEVDIACGLLRSYVLAMECKVTNDETNSVKRVNDVIKKAAAWKAHWGSFVVTAALLQGVIAAKDVQRLTDQGVHVFWSHDLEEFKTWLSERMA